MPPASPRNWSFPSSRMSAILKFAVPARPPLCICWLFLLLMTAAPAPGQQFTISGGLQWSQAYRADDWQPVRLALSNDTDHAVDGIAKLPLSRSTAPDSAQRIQSANMNLP